MKFKPFSVGLSANLKAVSKKSRKGRRSTLGKVYRFNFYLPIPELEEIRALIERSEMLRVKPRISVSSVLREGGKLFVARQSRILDQVEQNKVKRKHENKVQKQKVGFIPAKKVQVP